MKTFVLVCLGLAVLIAQVSAIIDCGGGRSCEDHHTCCSQLKCCPHEHATCCFDGSDGGEHCCPSGYACDVYNGRCVVNGKRQLIAQLFGKQIPMTQLKTAKPEA